MNRVLSFILMLCLGIVGYSQEPDTLAVDSAFLEELLLLMDAVPLDSSDLEGFDKEAKSEPADTALMKELELLIAQMEKQEKVRKVIDDYERLMLKREMSYNYDGVFNVLRGLILTKTEKDYRENAPLFKDTSNDWLDYGIAGLPALATYISKVSGVQSVSTTKRMVVSNALAFGLSMGLSSGLKGIVSERRPDASDNHSMPSRHTAFAFTAATILHREYGYKSPWVSIGGYSAAVATQFLRLHNNAHWINDLYIGAGIGMVSTNFAYFITDKILGADGIARKPKVTMNDLNTAMKFEEGPTGLSVVSGIEAGNMGDFNAEATYYTGLEYSYFFNKYLAVEGLCKMSTTKINEFQDNLLMCHADGAFKCSLPVYPGYRFAGRAICGGRFSSGIEGIDDKCFEFGGGCSIEYMKNEKYAAGVNFDYFHAMSDIRKNCYCVSMVWKVVF